MNKKHWPGWRIINTIFVIIVICCMAKCVHSCRHHTRYGSEDNTRYKEIMKVAKKLPKEPLPLTEIFGEHENAYFIYMAPYAFIEYIPCPQFSKEFIKGLGVRATSLETISRWVVFDENGLIEAVPFFEGMYSYGYKYGTCARLENVYWTPGTNKLEDTTERFIWRLDQWSFAEIADYDAASAPPAAVPAAKADEPFESFLQKFTEDPVFQLNHTAFPLKVFYMDPAEEDMYVLQTIYYAKPATPREDYGRVLFPYNELRSEDGLIIEQGKEDNHQIAVVLSKKGRETINTCYIFAWNDGWYLQEIYDSSY